MKRFAVIGGGISGLAAAHRLAELSRGQPGSFQITLLEASPRFGGLIETQREGPFLLERGADAFISDKPWGLELCRRLGIEREIIETSESFRRSFVVRGGRLVPVPAGFCLVGPTRLSALVRTPLLSWAGKARAAIEPFIPRRADDGEESVGQFIRRRFGPEVYDRLGQPMVGGIYSADPDRLSLQATLPKFREMERRCGSVVRGFRAAENQASGPRYSLFLSLKGGMERLVEALIQKMPEVALRHSSAVSRLEYREQRWVLTLQGGEAIHADAVCVAVPAGKAAALLDSCAPALSAELEAIAYESVAAVNVIFRRSDVAHPLDGFGFVVPAIEGRSILGATFSSVKFPGRTSEETVLIRAFVGGAFHRELVDLEDAAMKRMVVEELRGILGIRGEPVLVSIHRCRQAMPQYELGHLGKVAAIEEQAARYPGLHLTGNAYRGVGIPDCIHQAEMTADRMASA